MMSSLADHAFPRLAYLGDVPVEDTYHGSLQLYRLLDTYPKDRLLIVEAGNSVSAPARRLKGATYLERPHCMSRLRASRFASGYFQSRMHLAGLRAELLLPAVRRFGADAVLSVSHEAAWLSASVIARRLGVPLHLICHDEWALEGWAARGSGTLKDQLFGRHYRAAASRLCISPAMAQENAQRYGVPGDVLYPSRSRTAPRLQPAPARRDAVGGPVCGYAGSIASSGLIRGLDLMAQALAEIGGKLVIFGPFTAEHGRSRGLARDNIVFGGHADDLIETLRETVDLLFLPMSFSDEDQRNIKLCFPSKLADYTLAGLPIVIMGPAYSSAAQWSRDNAQAAMLITQQDIAMLQAAVMRIASEPGLRMALSAAALLAGEQYFSHAAVFSKLRDVLVAAPDAASVALP